MQEAALFDLVAEGSQPGQRWRKRLPEGMAVVVGRTAPPFDTPWDSQVSRRHVEVIAHGDRVAVSRIAGATNPVFFQGEAEERFELQANQRFVIGKTTFTLLPNQAVATFEAPVPLHQRSFSDEYLHRVAYRDVRGRLEILSELPSLIAGAGTPLQLHDTLARMLLRGVLRAQSVGIVEVPASPGESIRILHWDSRRELAGGFQPSESLIRQAVNTGETVLHVWRGDGQGEVLYTIQQNADWAFVCPLRGHATGRQALYISGQSGSEVLLQDDPQLQDDMKFASIAGATYSSLCDLRQLEHRQASLRSFFSPVVIDALAGQDIGVVLEPRECRLSILFGDLRGFSGTSERLGGNLLELLGHVSRALGAMTRGILDHRGVVGDFHGDAVMGFWGWPIAQPDAPQRAVQAALSMARQFRDLAEDHGSDGTGPALPPGEFMTGIGISSGLAVAGKIGSADQVKVTAFGPVVNLAARLESLTRWFRVPILCDDATARALASGGGEGEAFRLRKLARILPVGLVNPVELWQVLPDRPPHIALTEADFEAWDQAMELLKSGDWEAAARAFQQLNPLDRPREYMLDYIRQHLGRPPDGWDGTIVARGK